MAGEGRVSPAGMAEGATTSERPTKIMKPVTSAEGDMDHWKPWEAAQAQATTRGQGLDIVVEHFRSDVQPRIETMSGVMKRPITTVSDQIAHTAAAVRDIGDSDPSAPCLTDRKQLEWSALFYWHKFIRW